MSNHERAMSDDDFLAELESVPDGPMPMSVEEYGELVAKLWNDGHKLPCFFCGSTEDVGVEWLPPHFEFRVACCEECYDRCDRRHGWQEEGF